MNKTLNRLTTIFFFLLFFVLSPLLIFYAKGYRFNIDTKSVEKNGAFYVKSFPSGASIFVDDIKANKNTPTQLIDIKPGLRKLKVSKKLYVDWQKELPIHPGETTFAEDIVLFLKSRPKESIGFGSDNHIINKQNNKYAYIDSMEDLYITDVEQSLNLQVASFDQEFEILEWSYDNEKILLSDQKNYYIFDINKKENKKLALSTKDKIIFDTNNAYLLWYLDENNLYKYDYGNQSNLPELVKLNKNKLIINDFDLYEDDLIIQYGNDEKQYIDQINKYNLDIKLTLNNIIQGHIDVLLADDDNLIFVLGSNLNIKNKERDLISIPVTKAKIHDNRILITSGHEILLYNFKEDWQELIDRSSQIISDILWHPNGSYFLSEIDGQTKITEIDGRDKRNSVDLYEDYLNKIYLFNNKGDKLFVLTPEENFYLTIQ